MVPVFGFSRSTFFGFVWAKVALPFSGEVEPIEAFSGASFAAIAVATPFNMGDDPLGLFPPVLSCPCVLWSSPSP